MRELELRLAEQRVATAAELDALLAADFFEHGASGRRYGREEVLANYPFGSPRTVVLTEVTSSWLGSGALLLTYSSQEPDGRCALRASLWVRVGHRWQLRFHQGTMRAPAQP